MKLAITFLFALGAGELAAAMNCVWTVIEPAAKDVFVWDDGVSPWSAASYWNSYYDKKSCFKSSWNVGNGALRVGINDGTHSIGFYYNGVWHGTYPDGCFTNQCTYVETGGKPLRQEYLPNRGFRFISYCDLQRVSCQNEFTALKNGGDCSCNNRQLVGDCFNGRDLDGLIAGC
ncbi:hypothetical protein DFJ73DRAFT_764883 [Zopfochytrium polystomum]|nr:hypothetical protein DFJ73DRAFT_764883 [Zopfochytrium polystomum]